MTIVRRRSDRDPFVKHSNNRVAAQLPFQFGGMSLVARSPKDLKKGNVAYEQLASIGLLAQQIGTLA